MLNVGESGLSTRLFTPVASLCPTPVTIEGRGSLLRRPMQMMFEPLRRLGVRVRDNGGFLPIEVCGPIQGGEAEVDGSVSSQFITGLLLALPLARRDTSLHVRGAVSTPYLDMTLDTAARFGIEISQRDYEEFYIPGRQHYRSTYFSIEGDWSAAAMLLVAGATAGEVTVRNVSMLSKQADTAICTALVRAGAAVINEEDSVTALHRPLRAFEFDATNCPDLFPALAALAVLLYSLGRAKGRIKEKSGFTAACMLGAPLAAPAKLVFKALGLSAQSDVTEEDVLSFVDDVEEHDLIDESQKKMITNIFELDDVTAGDVMTHRTEIVSVEENTPAADAVRLSLEHGFSRLPVYRKSLDDIVGILYVKDLFALWDTPEKAQAPVSRFMRGAMFVPEACRAQELLVDFKVKHTQIAVVVDEYGGTSGLATMEDVLEEIVGNIQDEFDNEDEDLVATEDGFVAAGSADLEEVFEAFGLEPPDEDEDGEADFDTVGGLIIDRLGRIPAAGEDVTLEYGGLEFTVLEVEDRRVGKVKCTRAPELNPENDDDEEEDA